MTNKEIIRKVNDGFNEGDNEKILSYVTQDVTWDMPGGFAHIGKDAFRKELNNENFVGVPIIKNKNDPDSYRDEEGDNVAGEGEVQCKRKTEVCLMRSSLIFTGWPMEK